MVEDTVVKDVEHFYKNKLQIFVQKRNLAFPVYTCDREGPVHASRFRCKVKIDGKTYDTVEFFRSTKEAEHAAAKVALSSLSKCDVKEGGFQMYKNLLQEFCQKQGYELPVYRTSRRCEVHTMTFISIVEISGESFTEQRSSMKKMAEMNAAKVAYTILKERKASQNSTPQHSLLRGQSSSYFAPQSVSSASNLGDVVSETAGGFRYRSSKQEASFAPLDCQFKKDPVNFHESIEATQSNEIGMTTKDDAAMKEMQHLYKNELQTLAQRRNLALPTYTCEREGNHFRCKVVIDGKAYETLETFQSTKQAEHVAPYWLSSQCQQMASMRFRVIPLVDIITRKSQYEHKRLGDPFPGARSSSRRVSSSAPFCSRTSVSSAPLPCDLTGLPPNEIRIYPHSMNMKFPEKNIVLCDKNWVAVSSDSTNRSIEAVTK